MISLNILSSVLFTGICSNMELGPKVEETGGMEYKKLLPIFYGSLYNIE